MWRNVAAPLEPGLAKPGDKETQLYKWEPKPRYWTKDSQRIADHWHVVMAMVAQIPRSIIFRRYCDFLIMPSGKVMTHPFRSGGGASSGPQRTPRTLMPKHALCSLLFACHGTSALALGRSCGYLAIS